MLRCRVTCLPGCPPRPPAPPQDNGTEHPHRVCISTRADMTSTVVTELERGVADRGLQVCVGCGGGEAPARGTAQAERALEWKTAVASTARALPPLTAPVASRLCSPVPRRPQPSARSLRLLRPQCKVIVSGVGDWRYVDVTAARAGKLAALEYVRQLYGVHHTRCVAAGDSGNDTLMLGGRNLAIGGWGGIGAQMPAGRQARCPGPGVGAPCPDAASSARSDLARLPPQRCKVQPAVRQACARPCMLPALSRPPAAPPRPAVVGNAQPELVQWVLEQPQEERMVVTDAPMARGILEGLARHGLY